MSDLFTQVGVDNCQPETSITIFNFNGSSVRVTKDDSGDPWFVAKDVAEILDYRMASDMTRRLDDDERDTRKMRTPSGEQEMTVISESGLYSAILGSSKPEAKSFKKWVTGEVLPAIRKDGGYLHAAPEETPEQLYQRCMSLLNATIERQKAQLESARATITRQEEKLELAAPKVAFVETFATSTKGNILVRDFAKQMARSLGMRGFGQKHMFDWLQKHGYMNLNRYPSQRSEDMNLLEFSQGFHVHKDGTTGVHHCSRITPKGQTYFFEKIKEQFESSGRWW